MIIYFNRSRNYSNDSNHGNHIYTQTKQVMTTSMLQGGLSKEGEWGEIRTHLPRGREGAALTAAPKVQEVEAVVKRENAPVSTRLLPWSLRVLRNGGKASARMTPSRLKTGRL